MGSGHAEKRGRRIKNPWKDNSSRETTPLLVNTGQNANASTAGSYAANSTQTVSAPVADQNGTVVGVSNPTDHKAPDQDSEQAKVSPSWKEMMQFVYPFVVPADMTRVWYVVMAFVAVILGKITGLLPPLAIRYAIDTISSNATLPADKAKAPFMAVFLYMGLQICNRIIGIAESFAHQQVALDAERRFTVAAFKHLHSLGLAYHLERKTGEITHMMDRGSSTISNVIDTVFFSLLPTLFETVLVTAIFWKLGAPVIALTVFASVTVYIAFTVSVTKYRIRVRRRLNDADDAVENKAVETLINYETVTMFARTQDEINHYDDLRQKFQHETIKVSLISSLLNFLQRSIQQIGLCVGLCIACYNTAYANPRLSSGDFVVIQLYINQLFSPLMFLGFYYRTIVNALTDLEKVMAVLAKSPEVVDAPNAPEWVPLMGEESFPQGEVIFDNVSFRYTSGPRVSSENPGGGVANISFTVSPGKVVALVGKSGSGKSTLMRLALRLYDVKDGAIYVDGHDIRSVTQESLRKNIGVVAQETVLFNNTLRYNIAYGKEGATDAEVWQAARAAALGDMIESLPDKMDALVGERGLKLSGGERQRVGIARCIIKNPAILLFDEATSALDTETEREIQANLTDVCRSRTTIMIAHRLSTITSADDIILIEDGNIKERGTHKELLEFGGKYARMWQKQTE